MSVRGMIAVVGVLALCAAGCSQRVAGDAGATASSEPERPAAGGLRTIFEGVRVDPRAGVVELDARVSPMLVADPRTPLIYLETVVCSPDTREHETLLVSPARPSHLHAAMLLAGMTPGEPGRWRVERGTLASTPPSGDRLLIEIVPAGSDRGVPVVRPEAWVVNARTGARLDESAGGWVFAGSRLVDARARGLGGGKADSAMLYDADGSGVIVGLASFGNEVIAWSEVISPEARVQAPEWTADLNVTPAPGTTVVVRLRKID